jgi:RNA polymerase sigma-B factor
MPLVRALASRYAGRGEPIEDLVQVGSIGLIKAVDRFDVDRGVDVASYAVPTIVARFADTSATRRGRCTCRAG